MLRARSERCDFEADEARPEDDDPLCRPRALDDRPAVLQRAEHEHVRRLGAGEGRGHGLGAGREKQAIERNWVALGERNFARAGVDGGDGRIEAQVDRVVGIKALIAQRQPFLWRAAGEIILRQIGAIDRRRVVAAQHDDAALVLTPAQHLGCGESRRAAADDHNLLWLIPLSARSSSQLERSSHGRRSCPRAARRATYSRDSRLARATLRQCGDRSRRGARGTAPYSRQ